MYSNYKLIAILGLLLILLPFLGFPNSWDMAIIFLIGLFLIVLALIYRLAKPLDSRNNGNIYNEETSYVDSNEHSHL